MSGFFSKKEYGQDPRRRATQVKALSRKHGRDRSYEPHGATLDKSKEILKAADAMARMAAKVAIRGDWPKAKQLLMETDRLGIQLGQAAHHFLYCESCVPDQADAIKFAKHVRRVSEKVGTIKKTIRMKRAVEHQRKAVNDPARRRAR